VSIKFRFGTYCSTIICVHHSSFRVIFGIVYFTRRVFTNWPLVAYCIKFLALLLLLTGIWHNGALWSKASHFPDFYLYTFVRSRPVPCVAGEICISVVISSEENSHSFLRHGTLKYTQINISPLTRYVL
jgi:hypothetical protein